jgi:glycosyltransferase involved in cell wall biosynthesis
MNIVVLTHSNRTGGVEKFIAEFRAESRNRVSVMNVDIPIGWLGVWGYRKKLARFLPEGTELILSCHIDTAVTGAILAQYAACAHVFREPAGYMHAFLHAKSARILQTSLCIAESTRAIERWRSVGFAGSSCVIRPRIYAFAPMRIPTQNMPLRVVLVGNLFPEKNHPAGLRLVDDLANYLGIAVRLDVIGNPTGTSYSREVESRILAHPLATLVPDVTDVPALLGNYSFGVLVSDSEGFGNVLLEFAAGGLPFFTTRTEGISEVVPNNSPVLLPKDSAVWAEHIAHTLASPHWAEALHLVQCVLCNPLPYAHAYDEALRLHCTP